MEKLTSLKMSPGSGRAKPVIPSARISNVRLDRTTLISLEGKRPSDAREKLAATQGKKDSDRAYLKDDGFRD